MSGARDMRRKIDAALKGKPEADQILSPVIHVQPLQKPGSSARRRPAEFPAGSQRAPGDGPRT